MDAPVQGKCNWEKSAWFSAEPAVCQADQKKYSGKNGKKKMPKELKKRIEIVQPGAESRVESGAESRAEIITPEVTPEVGLMLSILSHEMSRKEIMTALKLKDEKHFRKHYQQVAVATGCIEMTIPDKPNSRFQKYRLTEKGREVLTRNS